MSTLEQLRKYTTIVADTADSHVLDAFQPQDGTTNPSHILQAAKLSKYVQVLKDAATYGTQQQTDMDKRLESALLMVLVQFGAEILKHVPGRVSTEVDAIHTFDTQGTVSMAREIVALYASFGIDRSRVLIKIASTWEGLMACEVLEKEGIHCNMTLVFSLVQAKLAAEVGATLISPFVGRTMDWYQKHVPGKDYTGHKDPGVVLVKTIYDYYKSSGIKTEVMAASLRNMDECIHLAGCDLMTIAAPLLEELRTADYAVSKKQLSHPVSNGTQVSKTLSSNYLTHESDFRLDLFADQAATDKINESLRIFLRDGAELKHMLEAIMNDLAASPE
ncbi:transaldolase, partial [Aureobasidium melanogenum]